MESKVHATLVMHSNRIMIVVYTTEDARRLWQLGGFGNSPEFSSSIQQYNDSKAIVAALNNSTPLITVLSLEETLYLMNYHSEIFSLNLQDKEILGLEYMRNLVNSTDAIFHFGFETYSVFRQNGWIVRPGLKYGVDFLLYKNLPGIVHSDFGVAIVHKGNDPSIPSLSWLSLIATCRTIEQVKKKLILAIQDDTKTCGSKHNNQMFLKVQRWDPQHTRQKLHPETSREI